MDVNKFKILQTPGNKNILVPLGNNEDLLDREGAIIQQEAKIIEDVIGVPINYELARYSNAPDNDGYTQLSYNFYFTDSPSNPALLSYESKFTESQVRYKTKQFRNSFFKLDFYDTPDPKKQKAFFTIILPTIKSNEINNSLCDSWVISVNQFGRLSYTDCCGNIVNQTLSFNSSTSFCKAINTPATFTYTETRNELPVIYNIDIDFDGFENSAAYSLQSLGDCACNSLIPPAASAIPNLLEPSFLLDHTALKEGFYIYWYENSEIVENNIFYMSAKFFNASNGKYIKFIINDQSSYSNSYRIPNNDFYHRLVFNYGTKTYRLYGGQSPNNSPLNLINTVRWFEYMNPPV